MSKPFYDTFLSHSSNDKPAVETLARRLKSDNIEAWLDKWHLIPGKPWQEEIEAALAACETCCVCIGPGGIGPWQNEEMRAAIGRRVAARNGFRVIPVLLPGSARPERSKLPIFLTRTSWVEFTKSIDEEQALHRLKSAIRGVAPGPGPGQAVFEGACPYRGLEVFDVEHAPFFYGRNALTEWLLDQLKARPGRPENRFLAIIGASGSGKSSLARAGVLAELKSGKLPGSGDWPQLIIKPGSDPLESLAIKLAQSAADSTKIRAQLSVDPAHLHREIRFAFQDAPEGCRRVLLVDQVEEVFTLCRDAALRRAFIDNLLYAASEPVGQTIVLLTLRADFYGKCAEHEGLSAALADHQLLVAAMSESELREAIEPPAFQAGCELEPGLTDLLVQDVRDRAGALPLLQYTLKRLWERRKGNRLTIDAYYDIGGLSGALKQRADEIYNAFDESQREACQRIFLRLTEPGEGTEDTRRRARRSELGTDVNTGLVLEALTTSRLITTGYGKPVGDSMVEISHEALIRGWPRLRSWVEANRESLRIQHRLSEATHEWRKNERDSDYLYRGGRLSQTEEWAQDRRNALSADERAFVDASVALRDTEAQEREQQRKQELEKVRELAAEKSRSARRLQTVVGVVLLAFVVTAAIAVYAYVQKVEADAQTERAEAETIKAREAQAETEKQALLARRSAYNVQLARVQDLWRHHPTQAHNLLFDTRQCPIEFRDFTWGFFFRLVSKEKAALQDFTHDPLSVAFSPDGRILASGS
jgi:energy-coupling factor transporter ATP-binding protein EcfA2